MNVVTERSGSQARFASASAGEVLQHIRSQRATTRSELVEVTGLSRATLGQRLEQLMRHRLVVVEPAPSTGGRPPRQFAFNPQAGVILCADLGATHGTIAVADLAGRRIASRARSNSPSPTGPSPCSPRCSPTSTHSWRDSGHERDAVWATGIGVPGPVDFASGRPIRPPIMPGWDNFDIRGWFAGASPDPSSSTTTST